MARVVCNNCSGHGYNYKAAIAGGGKEECETCEGTGRCEDGRFEPFESSLLFGFAAVCVLGATAIVRLLFAAKPMILWLVSLGWWAAPVVAAAVLLICVAIEIAHWALTLKRRRLAVVKAKINQA